MSAEPATVEMGLRLHRLLVQDLTRRMQERPSAADLKVARQVCQDRGIRPTAKDLDRLQELYAQVIVKLLDALKEERPSAAVLSESLRFLQMEGISKAGAAEAAQALQSLSLASLPFNPTMQ